MKIAIFTDVFLDVPGGIPSSIKAQKSGLEALGHKVIVFAPGFNSSLRNLTEKERKDIVLVPTHLLLKPNGAPLSKRPELVEKTVLQRFPKFDFDVVHVHYEASCSIAGMKLARRFSRLLVQTMHGREDMAVQINVPFPLKTVVATVLCFLHSRYIPHVVKMKKMTASMKELAPTKARAKMWEVMVNHANYADKVITPSEHFARKLQTMGVKKLITVVSNGVDDKMVAELDKRVQKIGGSLVRKVEPGDILRLFWNSRLSNEKRIMPFMEALSLMREPFFCTFVGDGNALNKAKRFADKHRLNNKVKFYGRVPHEEVLDKMLSQHLSVTVSYGFDTQGLTLLEAEATGMPVFFCDPDMKEIVPEGSFIMASGPSPAQMAKALDSVAREPERILKMSEVMLKRRKEILQSAQNEKLLKVYEEKPF